MTHQDQRRASLVVIGTCLVGAAALGVLAASIWRYPDRPHRSGQTEPVELVVARGMTVSAVARELAAHDLLDHPRWFRIYATERGDAGRVKPGRYRFAPAMTPRQLLDALIAGVADEEVAVTLPEGKNLVEVAELLDAGGVCKRDEFLRDARDPALLQRLAVPGDSFEGYLYPDRYQFRPGTPAEQVIARLVRHGREVYDALAARHPTGVAELKRRYGFDKHQILIMASLVEKETAQPDERPRIAGVFLNRLRLASFVPHLLQTDPTIVYGCTVPIGKSAACQRFEGRIRRAQLDDKDNPYNTYTHAGLPPGPICNPGAAAIEAVLQPESTGYLYFVSKNDGTHQFSKTRGEHEAAVTKYQRSGLN